MELELDATAPDETPAGPLTMRTQRSGRVVAVLDGDAHLARSSLGHQRSHGCLTRRG